MVDKCPEDSIWDMYTDEEHLGEFPQVPTLADQPEEVFEVFGHLTRQLEAGEITYQEFEQRRTEIYDVFNRALNDAAEARDAPGIDK